VTEVADPERVLREWRVPAPGRWTALLLGIVPTVAAVVAWVQALVHLSGRLALGALEGTGIAIVLLAFTWWGWRRPRLVLTSDELVAVNPWGTQRVPLEDVVAVTDGSFARLHLRSGFALSVWAVSDLAAGWPQRGRGPREVGAAVEAAHAARTGGTSH
jgi:hypothetical protein